MSYENVSDLMASVPFVEIDGRTVYPDETGTFVLPNDFVKLAICGHVYAYSLVEPIVSCRLEQIDKYSNTGNPDSVFPAYYTNLPGGTYYFVMDLMDSIGNISKTVSKYPTNYAPGPSPYNDGIVQGYFINNRGEPRFNNKTYQEPIREIEFNNKENRAHYVYEEMSENGRWTKKTIFDEKGRITSKYEVDGTSGKYKRSEYFDKKGRTTEVREYDAAGDVTKRTSFRKNGTPERTIEYNNGTETKRTYYDKKGKVEKVEKWNAEGTKLETAEFKDASVPIELAEAPKDPKLSPRGLRIAKRELRRALKGIEKSDDEEKFNAILENIKKKGNAEQQKELTQMVDDRKAALAEAEKKAAKAPEKLAPKKPESPAKKAAACSLFKKLNNAQKKADYKCEEFVKVFELKGKKK